MSNTFEINHQANIADLGTLVSEALFHLEDDNTDSVRDRLLEVHSNIYPNSSHTATPEENAKICAEEKTVSLREIGKTDVVVSKAVLSAIIEELAGAASLVEVVTQQLEATHEELNRHAYPEGNKPVMAVFQIASLSSLIDSKLLELQGNLEFWMDKTEAA